MQATRAIIHIDNFLVNFRAIQARIGPERLICVPIKADAYGHGCFPVAQAAFQSGAYCVAVATVNEGIQLRSSGIQAPILLLSQPMFDEIPLILENSLVPMVSDAEFSAALDTHAKNAGVKLPIHIKIDTGMGRMGVPAAQAPALARIIASSAGLEYAGTATHLACADSALAEDILYTQNQLSRFNQVLTEIRATGIDPGIVHAANSGAVLLHPESWYDMVRPGLLLYGYTQAEKAVTAMKGYTIKPIMELRSKIVFMKEIKQGESLSYGRTWKAPRDTIIGVIPAGYADGLPRLASNRWQVSINGRLYPLAGRICMDQCLVDLGPDPAVKRWDEVSIFGGPAPDAAALAEICGTIPYEITCNINKRVPRVYVGGAV